MFEKVAIKRSNKLEGDVAVPPSKSHTMRALFFGLMAEGKTVVRNPLFSPDVEAMMRACRAFGAEVETFSDRIEIRGIAGKIEGATDVIDAGNSGQVLRFMGALGAVGRRPVMITGDESLRTNRPITPLLDALKQLGVEVVGKAPFIVIGPMQPGCAHLNGEDSQPVSGLLMAAPFVSGPVEIQVTNPGEKPWIDLTLSWLDRVGIRYKADNYARYFLEGSAQVKAFDYTVPGDFSSSAFPLAAALLGESEVTFHNLDMDDAQGDKKLIEVFRSMGAQIEVNEEIRVRGGQRLKGVEVDVNAMIDATPILAVLGCFAEGETRIRGAAVARKKECDRIACIVKELRKMGADVVEHHDGLTVRGSKLKGAKVEAHADHRMAMALTVAGLGADGETHVEGVGCVSKSYPDFFKKMKALGAKVKGSE